MKLLFFLLENGGLILPLIEQLPILALLLLEITAFFLLLLPLLVDFGDEGSEILLQGYLGIDALDSTLLLLIFLEVLVDDLLHVVVLLGPIEVDLVLLGHLDGLAVLLPQLVVLELALVAGNGGVEGEIDRFEFAGGGASEVVVQDCQMRGRFDVSDVDVGVVERMVVLSVHLRVALGL
jgi:hypothetical protein